MRLVPPYLAVAANLWHALGVMDVAILVLLAFVIGSVLSGLAVALVSAAHARHEEYVEDGWPAESSAAA